MLQRKGSGYGWMIVVSTFRYLTLRWKIRTCLIVVYMTMPAALYRMLIAPMPLMPTFVKFITICRVLSFRLLMDNSLASAQLQRFFNKELSKGLFQGGREGGRLWFFFGINKIIKFASRLSGYFGFLRQLVKTLFFFYEKQGFFRHKVLSEFFLY